MQIIMKKLTLILSVMALSLPLMAQDLETEIPVERLRPALDKNGIIDTEDGRVAPHLNYDVGLWFWYAHNPLIIYSIDQGAAVERQQELVGSRINASLTGQIALFDFMQIGLELPFVPFQSRPAAEVGDVEQRELAALGFGDLRLTPKFNILNEEDFFLNLAIMPTLTLPTAKWINTGVGINERVDYLGEKFVTFVPEFALSKNFGSLRVASNLGYRFRQRAELLDLDVDGEFTYSVATAYKFHESFDIPLELGAALSGQWTTGFLEGLVNPFEHINRNPLELLGQVKYDVMPNRLQAFVGGGLGLIAGYGTPDFRVFAGLNYAPRGPGSADRDGDGILDADDQCPDDPEDKDGFEDANGCPDTDNDNDGVLDTDDRCPLEPEDIDTFEDENGCPDPDNDNDGVLDADDACPLKPGSAESKGCPVDDRDNDGIVDSKDACPDEPEDRDNFEDEDGCEDADNDKDGILDKDDKCPLVPEDKDGFEDEDGCDDVDNDKDGFKDSEDKCPNKPETVNGNKDDDGCPDKGKTKVKFTGKSIVILEKVYFDTAKAKIKPRSFNLLQQVATIMKTHPEVTKLSIEGHTDSRGSDSYNLDLSDRRAKAVRTFLITRGGIAPERMVGTGYGETKPIATNGTKSGREENRRVEFNVVEMNGKPVDATKSIESSN